MAKSLKKFKREIKTNEFRRKLSNFKSQKFPGSLTNRQKTLGNFQNKTEKLGKYLENFRKTQKKLDWRRIPKGRNTKRSKVQKAENSKSYMFLLF